MINSKATKAYWDATYERTTIASALNPRDRRLKNHSALLLHKLLERNLSDLRGGDLLEIGCGASCLLPYFARELGLNVVGIDYSERGASKAREILAKEQVVGEVFCADVFAPPPNCIGRFDVVVSFGVVEHFPQTASCISAFAKFLKPGGRILTSVPNMSGLVGRLQRFLDPTVYKKHVPLDAVSLRDAHERAGFAVASSDYFQSCNFFVVNINEVPRRWPEWYWKSGMLQFLHYVTGMVWITESIIGPLKPGPFMSSYVVCIADLRLPT